MFSVSIVIPAKNEERYITKCLDSIINQSYPKELIEAIVVDGMSKDNTPNLVKEYSEKYGNVRLLFNEKQITPISLNLGIKSAKGDIVIILGAHSYIDVDFVKNNVRNLNRTEVDCSGGVIETINEGIVAKSIAYAMSSPFGVGNALFRYSTKETFVDTVAFGAYKKSTLDKIGYFDEELVRNQDDELNFRLIKNGGKILLSPDIKSYYYSRSSLKKLWRQYYQYGFWKVRVIQKHKKPASIRHLIPITFVLSIILSLLGSLVFHKIIYLFALIIGSYSLLNILFTAKIALNNNRKSAMYLPSIFFILHFSYGLGFLFGFFNFYIFKSKKLVQVNSQSSR